MKEKSFSVIVQLFNLRCTSEMATDNLFKLEDSSYAVVDYESSFSEKCKIKYVSHITRILKKYGSRIRLRMTVLCTSDMSRINTVLNVGCLRLSIEAGYLSSIETDKVLETVRKQSLPFQIRSLNRSTQEN